MASTRKPVDRDNTPPFHIKVYYRTGAYLRTEELLGDPLPPYKPVYAWKDSTLLEISESLTTHDDDTPQAQILPHPYIGTRLEYRHIFRAPVITTNPRSSTLTTTNTTNSVVEPLRFLHKDIGSVVLGAGRPGASEAEEWDGISNDSKTLEDIRFVQGDGLICAIMPPDESTGDVSPANTARVGRGHGIGEAGAGDFGTTSEMFRPSSAGDGRYHGGGNGGGFGGFGGGGGGRRPSRGRGGPPDSYYQHHGPGRQYGSHRQRRDHIPAGEWSRGEIPDPNRYR